MNEKKQQRQTHISANNIYKMKSKLTTPLFHPWKTGHQLGLQSLFARFAYWWRVRFDSGFFFFILSRCCFCICMIFTCMYVWMPPNNGINRIALRWKQPNEIAANKNHSERKLKSEQWNRKSKSKKNNWHTLKCKISRMIFAA